MAEGSMLHHTAVDNQIQFFLRDKHAWENAIALNISSDPLEMWYNYICWYDYNVHIDPENKFRETLEKCLSLYENIDCYKQDLRIVKLWVKYIDLQPNPLNLYQLLYQRGIGTQSSCFYISWAHYYDSANAFKQAESVYNLGFQAKAEPYTELQDAHTKFRLSVSQRMLYNDSSSKKISVDNLCEQRQQITMLTPPLLKKNKTGTDNTSHTQEPTSTKSNIMISPCYDTTFSTIVCIPEDSRPQRDSYINLKDSAYVISSSLNYIYNSNQPLDNSVSTVESLTNVTIPINFARQSKNNYEMWKPLLFLEEPYDENKRCMYQKHLIYPGDKNEYSPEEVRANKRNSLTTKTSHDASSDRKLKSNTADSCASDKSKFYVRALEDQIEASTIRFSMESNNGEKKNKTIKIKFRRDNTSKNNTKYILDTEDPTIRKYEQWHNTKVASTLSASFENLSSTPLKEKIKKNKIKTDSNYIGFTSNKKNKKISLKRNEMLCKYRNTNKRRSEHRYADASLLLAFANINSNDGINFAIKEENLSAFSCKGDNACNMNSLDNTSNYSSVSPNKSSISCKSFRKYDSSVDTDELCSYEQNSFFSSDGNEELKNARLKLALHTIDKHLSKSIIDPFNSELCKAFLTKLEVPSRKQHSTYNIVDNPIQKISTTKAITLAETEYTIEKEVGKGSYGSVYKAVDNKSGNVVALKFQRPANIWELYICMEVRKRIKDSYIFSGFMDITSATIAPNASIFVTEFSAYGSLLDINNKLRQATKKVMHESLVIHFSCQILSIVEYLHSCNIIHADIKPDNFLLMKIPNSESDIPSLRLIDFGCAIDMTLFPQSTQFKKVIQTDGFTCIEMQEGRPWSYQTDLFCIAGTVHVMLFGEYMQILKKFDLWDIRQKLPRYLKKHVWNEFFPKMLNIKDVEHLPNLNLIKNLLDNEINKMDSELQTQIRTLSNILHRR